MLFRLSYIPFEYTNNYYIYSHTQKSLFKTNSNIYSYLVNFWENDQGGGHTPDELDYHFFPNAIEMLFKPDSSMQEDDNILYDKWVHPSSNFMITFEMTQDCNMSCRHCWYGGIYKNVRGRSNLSLSCNQMLDAAKSLQQKIGSRPVRFGFFGGEPTLELDEIIKFIHIVKDMFNRVSFSMTTNFLHYDNRIARLYNEVDLHLSVSIDGYKEAHDFARLDINGEHTFDKISRNMGVLFDNITDLSRLHLSMVLSTAFDLHTAYEYIKSSNLALLGKQISANYLSYADSDVIGSLYSHKQIKRYRDNYDNVMNNLSDFIRLESSPCTPRIVTKTWLSLFRNLNETIKYGHHYPFYAGFCYPGLDTIYVTAEGKYKLCHMADYTDPGLEIGCISSGIDENACKDIFSRTINFARAKCFSCKALPLCTKCIGLIACRGDWDNGFDDTPRYCKTMINIAQTLMRSYLDLRIKSTELLNMRSN